MKAGDFMQRRMDQILSEQRSATEGALKGGGGGGTSGGMEPRVTKLEDEMRTVKDGLTTIRETLIRIEGKIDTRASAIDLAEIKGKLDAKASASDVSILSGKIDEKPDTWKVVIIVLALGAIMGGSQIIKTIVDVVRTPAQQTHNEIGRPAAPFLVQPSAA